MILETHRLRLRVMEESDLEELYDICCDPLVMEYFPKLATKGDTKNAISRIRLHQKKYGYSFYAVEIRDTKQFIGFVGLKSVAPDFDFYR
jgi:RimJ/RimL family protein N-acetyltransferase